MSKGLKHIPKEESSMKRWQVVMSSHSKSSLADGSATTETWYIAI